MSTPSSTPSEDQQTPAERYAAFRREREVGASEREAIFNLLQSIRRARRRLSPALAHAERRGVDDGQHFRGLKTDACHGARDARK